MRSLQELLKCYRIESESKCVPFSLFKVGDEDVAMLKGDVAKIDSAGLEVADAALGEVYSMLQNLDANRAPRLQKKA